MGKQIDRLKSMGHIHKIVSIVITAAVLTAVAVVVVFFVNQKKRNSQSSASYREYSVSKGDVTVGVSESGTVALDDANVAFPVECTVGSVLVKSGQTVKKGDPLVKLDLQSVNDSSSDTKQKLEAAKISLQSAVNDQKAKLDAAKITYESSKYLASTAPATKELTLAQIQNDIGTAQTALANDQKDLATYQALQKSWPADYAKLNQLKQWMDDAQTNETSYNNQLTNYKDDNQTVLNAYDDLKKATETARENYVVAQNSSDSEDDQGNDVQACKDAYETAQNEMNDYYNDVAGTVVTQENDLESKAAQYTAEYNNYSTAYGNFKDTYGDKYKLTGSDLDAKIASLQSSVKTDQYNLQKAQKTEQISSLDADTKEKTDLNTAANADDAYHLTVNQLSEAVTAAQDSYDKLQNEMSEVNSALNGNGVLTSPCDGVIAVVAYKAGSSVAANQAMVTVSSNSFVSLSLSVSEDDITNVKLGQEASLTLSAYDGQSVDAQVESITAEPARSGSSSVTYTVVVKSTGKPSGLGAVYDGMSGDATIIQKRAQNVLYVSNRAVTFRNGISTVLVKDRDGTTSAKAVKTGFSDGSNVEITNGLQEGDTVLAESAVSAK